MRKVLIVPAVLSALLPLSLLSSAPAEAKQECVAIMKLAGVPTEVAEASDESEGDEDGDGDVWVNQGGGKMTGFIDCKKMPGAKNGDTYTQNYDTGKTRKTGNDPHTALIGIDLRSRPTSGTSHSSSSSSSSSSQTGASRPATSNSDDGTAPTVPGKKRAPTAARQ
jgi:hypothetical protein